MFTSMAILILFPSFVNNKLPRNITFACSMLNIEQTAQECDATEA